MSRESTVTRREAILSAAGLAMNAARRRRTRTARIATGAAILAFASIAAVLSRQPAQPSERVRPIAIDFQSIRATTESIDFAIVRETGVPVLDTLTDAEAEQALVESGYCVKIFRVQDRPMLVDCSTGARAVIGQSAPSAR